MIITFEISKPFLRKPFWFKSDICIRFGWLWFAVAWHPIRLDELIKMANEGIITWTDNRA